MPKIPAAEAAANAIAEVFANGSIGIYGVFQNPKYVVSDGEIAISTDSGAMIVAPEIATKIHDLITFVRTYEPPAGGGSRLKLVA